MPFTQYEFHIRTLANITEQLEAAGFNVLEYVYHDEGMGNLGELDISVDSLIVKAVKSA